MDSKSRTADVDPERLTPGTLIDGARMYAAAADAVNDRFPNSFHVLSQLLGMSLELALKAYLRKAGYTKKRLKALGHDLGRLFEEAKRHGLEHTGSRNFVLRVTGALYMPRIFAYPEECVMNSIGPWRLRQMARELIEISFRAIHGDDAYKKLKDEPGLAVQSVYPHDCEPSAWATKVPAAVGGNECRSRRRVSFASCSKP
jgi:hypothetical protein